MIKYLAMLVPIVFATTSLLSMEKDFHQLSELLKTGIYINQDLRDMTKVPFSTSV